MLVLPGAMTPAAITPRQSRVAALQIALSGSSSPMRRRRRVPELDRPCVRDEPASSTGVSGKQPTTRTRAEKCCVLRETQPESYGSGTGSDRRSNAAMGRTSWATAPASERGPIPRNERTAVSRRE